MQELHGASGAGPGGPTDEETRAAATASGLGTQQTADGQEYAGGTCLAATPAAREPAVGGGTSNSDGLRHHIEAPICCRMLPDEVDKAFATLRANFALLGWTCERSTIAGDLRIRVGRWGRERAFADIAAARTFLVVIGGAHAG